MEVRVSRSVLFFDLEYLMPEALDVGYKAVGVARDYLAALGIGDLSYCLGQSDADVGGERTLHIRRKHEHLVLVFIVADAHVVGRNLKAAVKVNDEMLRFFWQLGCDMDKKKEVYPWGSHFYEQVSKAMPLS